MQRSADFYVEVEDVLPFPRERVAAYAGAPARAPEWYATIDSVRWQTRRRSRWGHAWTSSRAGRSCGCATGGTWHGWGALVRALTAGRRSVTIPHDEVHPSVPGDRVEQATTHPRHGGLVEEDAGTIALDHMVTALRSGSRRDAEGALVRPSATRSGAPTSR